GRPSVPASDRGRGFDPQQIAAAREPDRHLGLEMGAEAALPHDALSEAAQHLETERLVDVAREPPQPPEQSGTADSTGSTIAVASDAAFCFRYPATIERLRERSTVRTFSPVAGDPVPECDGVYLPGGYPELHAAELAEASTLAELGDCASEGLPVFGECGGLMAMSQSLTTVEGDTYPMAGILPADVEMCNRYQALDHVELEAISGTLTAQSGESIRGHEFHYSSASVDPDARFAFDVRRGDGIDGDHDGLTEYDSLGTYAHVHAASGAFDRFVDRVDRS
ncbi:MAG: cobyrinic acid a,c-diamide synthase, partial [Halohasta sp.]